MANLSTTVPNSVAMSESFFPRPPVIVPAQNFAKKLSTKLEKLYKKKDYQLMLDLAKSKMLKKFTLVARPMPISEPMSPVKQLTITPLSAESDSETEELQQLIAEGEGKVKKRNYQVSYTTGTKSILCKRWVKLGQCPHGDHCEYAHSKKELQFNSPQEWVQLIKHISN